MLVSMNVEEKYKTDQTANSIRGLEQHETGIAKNAIRRNNTTT